MRASFAIPLLFTPFKYKGADLVDGGVLNPVPIAPTFGDEAVPASELACMSAADSQRRRDYKPSPSLERWKRVV